MTARVALVASAGSSSATLRTVVVLSALATAYANAQNPADSSFLLPYARQYQAVQRLDADMVVEELRQRVELIAARGSAVGAASNAPRVRGFETALLAAVQTTACPHSTAAVPNPARPMFALTDHIGRAATSQRLHLQGTDLAEVSALAQRTYDAVGSARWCTLKSLDEIR